MSFREAGPRPPLPFALALAVALPTLLAYNLTPAATLFNELLSLLGWGAVLLFGASALLAQGERSRVQLEPLIGGLVLLAVAPWVSVAFRGLPLSLGVGPGVVLAVGVAVVVLARGLAGAQRALAVEGLCWGLLVAGLLSVGVSLVQVFWPAVADGVWIARSGLAGRAIGNLRQPNHLASLLMWSSGAAVWLAGRHELVRRALPGLLLALVFAVVLSASRTGYVGVALLALWGLLDRSLAKSVRASLLATPVMMAAGWGLLALWSAGGQHAFGAAARLAEGAGSPSRMAILRDALELVRANPWLGVGWGEFNFAWSLTPFPHRHTAFFDHTHNLPLQLIVELGLPWALAVLGLLLWSGWRLLVGALRSDTPELQRQRRAMGMLVLMIGVHSLLEYPLWYAYFLLPAVFAFGLGLPEADGARASPVLVPLLGLAGALLVTGSAYAYWDYGRITAIYAPGVDAAPLPERIARGQRSWLFAHHADYAAATSLPPGPEALVAARRTAFSLIDARLLKHWAQSLAQTGDVEAARYLVDRLREFRNPIGDEWLEQCEDAAASAPAFPCQPASGVIDWRSLR